MTTGFRVAPEDEEPVRTAAPIAVEPIERMKTIDLLAGAGAEGAR